MSALRRFVRRRARHIRCGALRLIDARPCRHRAVARVLFRVLPGMPLRRVNACGRHDAALIEELAARGCADVERKAFVRPMAERRQVVP